MHPVDCPQQWDYEDYPHYDDILAVATAEILIALRRRQIDTLKTSCNTRPAHLKLFTELVPQGCEYFAGHYRGENFRCLRYYEVKIQSDPRVGCPSDRVLNTMGQIMESVEQSMRALDEGHKVPNSQMAAEQKLLFVVAFACRMFELLLKVHPYANGNGHAARFMVWSILGRYGYWPKNWPLHPRPNEPQYSELIVRYRNGDIEPLERYMINNILGN